MIQIENYMENLIGKLRAKFGTRLCYVGLQGSYLRGEATEKSDIDVMLVLDGLMPEDMDAYREILMEMGHYDLSCGFICGLAELRNWNRLELCHVLHTTKNYYGSLADLIPAYSREDVRQYTLMSLNNLYHALCHTYVHAGKEACWAGLTGMYKSAFFILQSIHYLNHGEYAATKQELLKNLKGPDRQILENSMLLASGRKVNADEAFRLLFQWFQQKMQQI